MRLTADAVVAPTGTPERRAKLNSTHTPRFYIARVGIQVW